MLIDQSIAQLVVTAPGKGHLEQRSRSCIYSNVVRFSYQQTVLYLVLLCSLCNQAMAIQTPWNELTTRHEEPKQRYGFEFELGWASAGMSGKQSCGTIKQPANFKTFAITHGHHIVYKPKPGSEYTKWHFSLDGQVYLELVSDPLDSSQIEGEFTKIKDGIGKTGASLIKFIRTSFDRGVEGFDTSYDWFECSVKQMRPANPSQLYMNVQTTTTVTAEEISRCVNYLNTALRTYIGSSDETIMNNLRRTNYKQDAKLSMEYLIKHAYEQFTTTDIPGDRDIDKVKEDSGLHTNANKLAPLFIRDGKPAYVIETRRLHGNDINQASLAIMNTLERRQIAELVRLTKCSPVKAKSLSTTD